MFSAISDHGKVASFVVCVILPSVLLAWPATFENPEGNLSEPLSFGYYIPDTNLYLHSVSLSTRHFPRTAFYDLFFRARREIQYEAHRRGGLDAKLHFHDFISEITEMRFHFLDYTGRRPQSLPQVTYRDLDGLLKGMWQVLPRLEFQEMHCLLYRTDAERSVLPSTIGVANVRAKDVLGMETNPRKRIRNHQIQRAKPRIHPLEV